MFRLVGNIPEKFNVAVSGGVDSMVVLDFLLNGRHKPQAALYFDHGTEHGQVAKNFLRSRCEELGVNLIEGMIARERQPDESKEEYWRNERYSFFAHYKNVITAHHLDDAVEWWIFSSLHGQSKLIPYKRDNILRPFLRVPKSEIKNWADKKKVVYVEDPSNKETQYMRNHIRYNMVEQALVVNPGLRKVISRKLNEDYINKYTNKLQNYSIDDSVLYCI